MEDGQTGKAKSAADEKQRNSGSSKLTSESAEDGQWKDQMDR